MEPTAELGLEFEVAYAYWLAAEERIRRACPGELNLARQYRDDAKAALRRLAGYMLPGPVRGVTARTWFAAPR